MNLKQRTSRSRSRAATLRAVTLVDLSRIWDELGILRPIEFRVTFARSDDLLVCDFIFDNLKLDEGKLVRKVATATATLILEFPPQSFGEQAFLDKTGPDVPNPIPKEEEFDESSKTASPKNVPVSNAESFGSSLPFARIRIAGRSRIAFTMPQNENDLPFTLDAILDAARRWPMRLDSSAAPEPPARGLGVLDDALKDQTFFNKAWLASIATSADWNRAGEALFGALGARLEAPITAAATDIAARATAAINSGKREGLNDTLKRAMTAAVDELAAKYPALREGKTRDYALAALSMKSTQALTTSSVNDFDISAIDILPFLPVFLSPHRPSPLVTALELPYRVILSPIRRRRTGGTRRRRSCTAAAPSCGTRGSRRRRTASARTQTQSPGDLVARLSARHVGHSRRGERGSAEAVPHEPRPLDRQMLVKLMAGFNEKDDLTSARSSRTRRRRVGCRFRRSAHYSMSRATGCSSPPASVSNSGGTSPTSDAITTCASCTAARSAIRQCRVAHQGDRTQVRVAEQDEEDADASRSCASVSSSSCVSRSCSPLARDTRSSGRNFPFSKVEILTRVTPSLQAPGIPGTLLDDPDGIIYGPNGIPNRACFWPMLGANRNFMFQVAVTDLAGQRTPLAMPLLFVGVEANSKPKVMAEIIKRYNARSQITAAHSVDWAARRSATRRSKPDRQGRSAPANVRHDVRRRAGDGHPGDEAAVLPGGGTRARRHPADPAAAPAAGCNHRSRIPAALQGKADSERPRARTRARSS